MEESKTMASKLIDAEEYAGKYTENMAFERNLIMARHNECLRFIRDQKPISLVEVGCGPNLLLRQFNIEETKIQKWVVVEPSSYADAAVALSEESSKIKVVRGYLEEHVTSDQGAILQNCDAILLSGLLHETTNPSVLLDAAYRLLKPGGYALISVPNALSFHRLLAVEMGLISTPFALSARNLALGQPLVYDRKSLENIVQAAGFRNMQFSGYMFKPFTNDQMEVITASGEQQLPDALEQLGRKHPDHAAEIAVVAQKPDGI
jgi:SAM-dependent methyltransferase